MDESTLRSWGIPPKESSTPDAFCTTEMSKRLAGGVLFAVGLFGSFLAYIVGDAITGGALGAALAGAFDPLAGSVWIDVLGIVSLGAVVAGLYFLLSGVTDLATRRRGGSRGNV